VYTDDGIFALPHNKEVDKAINDMKTLFNINDQGNLKDYLGVNVEKLPNGNIKLTQPHLINQIITELKLSLKSANRTTSALSTKILQRNEKAPDFDQRFHYRCVVGQLAELPQEIDSTQHCLRNTPSGKVLSGSKGNTCRSNQTHRQVLTQHVSQRHHLASTN
jgi:hypothetical protein